MQNSLRLRLLTALVLIPPVIFVIWIGNPWYTLLLSVATLLAAWEFYRMVARSTGRKFAYWGLFWVALLLLSRISPHLMPLPVVAASAVILPLAWLVIRPGQGKGFNQWVWLLAGVLYVGWTMSYFLPLREQNHGAEWVFLTAFCTYAQDSAALFIGKAFGRHRMTPQISPHKTWEGAAGGFWASVLSALVAAWLLKLPVSHLSALAIGALIGIFGQFGDLVESLLKRTVEVKDSGTLVPGHGGVLDRIDSLMFSVIVVYYYVIWLT